MIKKRIITLENLCQFFFNVFLAKFETTVSIFLKLKQFNPNKFQ